MAITKTGVLIDTSTSFNNPIRFEVNGEANKVEVTGLTRNTQYYARAYIIKDGSVIEDRGYQGFMTTEFEYFGFNNPNNSSINLTLTKYGTPADVTGETSTDGGNTWTSFDMTGVNSQTWSIPANGKIKFRGNNASFSSDENNYYNFSCSNNILVAGNITTLIDSTGSTTTIPNGCFYYLFKHMTTLDNDNLSFGSVTALGNESLKCMMQDCYALTTSPDLRNVTSIGNSALAYCFNDCSSLITPPDLSGITSIPYLGLAGIFWGCTSLSTAPDLSNVTSIGDSALYASFWGCDFTTPPNLSGITYIPSNGLEGCFRDCESLTTPPDLSNVTSIDIYGLTGCFYGCTSLITPPNLRNVTRTGQHALDKCFYGCTSLITPPDLRNITSISSYMLSECFYNCTSMTTGPNLKNATRIEGNGLEKCFVGCTSLVDVTCPNVSNWYVQDTTDWLGSVSARGTVHIPSSLNIGSLPGEIPLQSDSGIPSGWTYDIY